MDFWILTSPAPVYSRNCFEYERTVQYEPRSNSWLDVPIRNNFTEGSNNCPPILKMMAQTPFRDRLALFYSRNAVSGHSIGHASHTTQCVWSISPIFQPQKLHLIETIMHKHRGPYFNFSCSSKDSCSSTLMCVRSWVWMQYSTVMNWRILIDAKGKRKELVDILERKVQPHFSQNLNCH